MYKNFTFQSGSIQIMAVQNSLVAKKTLHSNLVLFKWMKQISNKVNIPTSLHSNLVLFKCKNMHLAFKYFESLHSNLVLFK